MGSRESLFQAFHVTQPESNVHKGKVLSTAGSDKGLLLEFGSKQHVLFRNFSLSDLESALGLLEHLSDS